MEGLLDHSLRDVLTRVGGVSRCVSEFIRITDRLLPQRVFTRVVPELLAGSRTPAGVPVRPQLLGSDPVCLAENAAQLAQLQPAGIDLNFGCPAKTVNRSRGGAVLLDEPELIWRIVATVRRAVPPQVPVSAKMRLGYRDDRLAEACAQAIEAGGASELVVHARTQAHGYRPPAYWPRIAQLREQVRIAVIANGEIWTLADALHCRAQSGCQALMIGRGLVANPGLALHIAAHDAGAAHTPLPWPVMLPLLAEYWRQISARVAARHRAGRLKQWLFLLRRHYPEAQTAFDELRTQHDPLWVAQWLAQQGTGCAAPVPSTWPT